MAAVEDGMYQPTMKARMADLERQKGEIVNAVAELKEPRHAANRIAFDFKEQRRAWFRDLLKQLRVERSDALAMQLQILVDGAIAGALVRGDPKVARTAGDAARTLLAAAGIAIPSRDAQADGGTGRSTGRKRA